MKRGSVSLSLIIFGLLGFLTIFASFYASSIQNGGVDKGITMTTLQSFGDLSRGSIQYNGRLQLLSSRIPLMKVRLQES